MASQQSSADAASSSESVQISASATGSAQSSQVSSVPTSETRVANDPAPPSATPVSSSAPPAASKPASSPDAGTSAATTQPAATSASASAIVSASHPADTKSAAPAPPSAPGPASSAAQDSASVANPTSVHAVKDVSHAPIASATPTAAASPSPKPEVDASPSPLPAQPAPASAPPAISVSSDHGSEHKSGMVQANAMTSQASATTTSTITDQPETTLSTPFFMTVTDKDNHTTLSVPPIFTSVVVSELPDGVLTSYTHIIANPTGIYGVQVENQKGFFANSGVVAGVFLVVGVVVASFIVGLCLFIRRRRRPRFIDTISRPLPMPENPFEDPRPVSPPEMRYRSSFTDSTILIAGPPRRSGDSRGTTRSPFEERMQHRRSPSDRSSSSRSASRYNGLGLAGVGAHGRSASMGSADGMLATRSRHQSGQSGVVGLAITSDHRVDGARTRREHTSSSSARSSPSMYPPTLPSLHNEDVGELVDVPLNRSGSSHSVHSVTRKPVPASEPEPEPQLDSTAPAVVVSPTPRPPEQTTTRPPIVPPRSPLRRSSLVVPTQPLSPPPYKRAETQPSPVLTPKPGVPPRPPRDSLTLEMETIVLQAFEPLTPPASLSSLSPAGSSAGHDANPFVDAYERQLARAGPPGIVPAPGQGWGLPLSPRKDTFYTRRSGSQRRPSVEWKN